MAARRCDCKLCIDALRERGGGREKTGTEGDRERVGEKERVSECRTDRQTQRARERLERERERDHNIPTHTFELMGVIHLEQFYNSSV